PSSHVTVASTVWNSCSIGLCFVKQTRPFQVSLVCNFCSSVRDFASSFLQIPPRDGHPCLRLTVPTAKPVVDFHHQVIAHAGHTYKREQLIFSMPSLLMNYFFVGRSLFFQFSKPPSILTTFLKPFFCKILAAIAERFPVRQCTATGLSCGTSAKRSGR